MTTTVSKHINGVSAAEYTQLKAAAKDVRSAVRRFIPKYIRVFTEPRKNGLRTKFWSCKHSDIAVIERTCNKVLAEKYGDIYAAKVNIASSYYHRDSVNITIKKK